MKGLGLFLLLLTQTSFTSYFYSAENCFPENDLRIPVFDDRVLLSERTGITKEEFNTVLDEAKSVMGPLFEERGVNFSIERRWTDDKVNAAATQRGSNWVIIMYGGLARHELTTIDSFRSVVCHEIGHHLAGAPKVTRGFSSWASNEGQSDYYATYQCMKKLIIEGQAAGLEVKPADQSIYEQEELDFLDEQCAAIYGTENEVNFGVCKRVALAGLSGARLLELLGAEKNNREPEHVSFLTPDTSEVARTDSEHPKGQCRADTYLAGALCDLSYDTPLDSRNPDVGTCNREDNFEHGLRPRCWFKPGEQQGGGGAPDFPFPFPFPFVS